MGIEIQTTENRRAESKRERELRGKLDFRSGSEPGNGRGNEPESMGETVRVGLAALTPGAGATLLTLCAACWLAERGMTVSAAELGGGGIYHSLGMDRRFALREFHSFRRAAAGTASLRRMENRELGVNWALRLPGEGKDSLPYREALRLIYGLSGQAALFDFSGRGQEDLWLLAREMDLTVVLIDPMPQSLLPGRENLERWKLCGLPVVYGVNKYCGGVDRRELSRFLKLKNPVEIPLLGRESLYAAQYAGLSPWKDPAVRESLGPALEKLLGPAL